MSTPPIILSKELTAEILEGYAEGGVKAAREMALIYGLKASFIEQLAHTHGVRVRRPRGGLGASRNIANDPRWKRAVANGGVVV